MPLRGTVAVLPLEELLEMVMVPLADPAVVGLNVTWSVKVWPGFSVAGKVAPEIAKAAPVTVTEFTVTAVFPDAVMPSVLVEVAFKLTFPKSRLDELTVS